MTVIVFSGESETQAFARTQRWRSERRELLGYTGDSFIFKGRRCVGSLDEGPIKYIHSPKPVNVAEADNKKELEKDRPKLLEARAVREARNTRELIQLLAKYGVS